ncbi:MAG: hypothetical protein CL868_18215 [Cytophagaceae bacterium]|nr:hypothetical protein [Cytophagaceae bacterium]|tara:strand:- start:2863 stop:3402 length:540 start_codon:yes stop_codon:yes gene_type:complete
MDCNHCGGVVEEIQILNGHVFCGDACREACEKIKDSGLGAFYKDGHKGFKPKEYSPEFYESLARKNKATYIRDRYIGMQKEINFYVPQMRDERDVWLLSRLFHIHIGIGICTAILSTKTLKVVFDGRLISIEDIIENLNSIGYGPLISLKEKNHGKGIHFLSFVEKLFFPGSKKLGQAG